MIDISEGYEFYRFANVGDVVAGYYQGFEEVQYRGGGVGEIHILAGSDGDLVKFNGTVVLNEAMQRAEIGAWVEITYIGSIQSGQGKMKQFKVMADAVRRPVLPVPAEHPALAPPPDSPDAEWESLGAGSPAASTAPDKGRRRPAAGWGDAVAEMMRPNQGG